MSNWNRFNLTIQFSDDFKLVIRPWYQIVSTSRTDRLKQSLFEKLLPFQTVNIAFCEFRQQWIRPLLDLIAVDSQHLSENLKRLIVTLFSLFASYFIRFRSVSVWVTLSGASANFTFNESSGDPETLQMDHWPRF